MKITEIIGRYVAEFLALSGRDRTEEEQIKYMRGANFIFCLCSIMLAIMLPTLANPIGAQNGMPSLVCGLVAMIVAGVLFAVGGITGKTLSSGGTFCAVAMLTLIAGVVTACFFDHFL